VIKQYGLIVDESTLGLLKNMGFQYKTVQNVPQIAPVVNPQVNYTLVSTNNYLSTYSLMSSYSTGVTTGDTFSLPALYYLDLIEVSTIYLALDNTVSQHRVSYDGLRTSDFLLGITVNAAFDNLILYEDTGQRVMSYNSTLNLTVLHIKMYDQLGREIDFRGVPWTCQFLFEFPINTDSLGNGNAADLNMSSIRPLDRSHVARGYGSQDRDLLFPQKTITHSYQQKRSRDVL
jgi:hypothetical protein